MPKRCSLYWSRHAVSYPSNAYLGGAAPAATTLHPVLDSLSLASASRCAPLPEPALQYQSEDGAIYDRKLWVGRKDYQNKN